jgi:hypothetical protein
VALADDQVDQCLLGDVAALVVLVQQLADSGVGGCGVSHHALDRGGARCHLSCVLDYHCGAQIPTTMRHLLTRAPPGGGILSGWHWFGMR